MTTDESKPLPRPTVLSLPLRGPGGEPVDLLRTFVSHGMASLPPMFVNQADVSFEVTLPLRSGRPRTVRVTRGPRATARVTVVGRPLSERTRREVEAGIKRVLGLDKNLAPFYAQAADDPDLAWVTEGAGRMIASPTVFEEVVKTVCTTNCSWALTTKMVGALVENLGERASGGPTSGVRGRAFPTPEAMADAGEDFYKDVVRAGYRGPYFIALARSVASGEVDLEALAVPAERGLDDDEVDARLQALPGVGPYAAAHIMMMLGRYSRLILDSWTRPTYAKRAGMKRAPKDSTINRRFRRYGSYAGLAFWLFLTRDWVKEGEPPPVP